MASILNSNMAAKTIRFYLPFCSMWYQNLKCLHLSFQYMETFWKCRNSGQTAAIIDFKIAAAFFLLFHISRSIPFGMKNLKFIPIVGRNLRGHKTLPLIRKAFEVINYIFKIKIHINNMWECDV